MPALRSRGGNRQRPSIKAPGPRGAVGLVDVGEDHPVPSFFCVKCEQKTAIESSALGPTTHVCVGSDVVGDLRGKPGEAVRCGYIRTLAEDAPPSSAQEA